MDVAVCVNVKFLEVVKFTTITPLSSLASCILLLPINGLKMSSLPTFALNLLAKFSYGT
jgi:hypothetical protein